MRFKMIKKEELVEFYAWLKYQYELNETHEEHRTIGDVVDHYIKSDRKAFNG
jgi:hypothetical protein